MGTRESQRVDELLKQGYPLNQAIQLAYDPDPKPVPEDERQAA